MDLVNRGIGKLQSLYFNGKLFVNGKVGLPAQTGKEIRLFKAIFDNFMDRERINIFEWGSGLSTIYYAEYLKRNSMEFRWHSIDNNKTWHDIVTTKVKDHQLQEYVQLYLKEFRPFWEKPDWGKVPPECGVFSPKSENEKAYIDFPRLLDDHFDIVIIDARFRRHCVRTAGKVLKSDSIVVMHDAQKEHYHVGLDAFQFNSFFPGGSWYPFQEEPNRVWVGSMDNQKIFEALKKV